ncbi:MAG: MBG domain-containing protein [Bacteroidota bacterium]
MRRLFLFAGIVITSGFWRIDAEAQTDQKINNGELTTAIEFPPTGCLYNWTNTNPQIGLAASGSGNIPPFTAKNISKKAIIGTVTATPVTSGFGYIPNLTSNDVSVISTVNNKKIATIAVGKAPFSESVSPDGKKAYIANNISNSVSVIETVANKVIATVPVGTGPMGIVVSPDNSLIYVANFGSASVSIIDASSNTPLSTIQMPGTRPQGISISPDGSKLYVTDANPNRFLVVSTSSKTILATITVGSNPLTSAISSDGTRVYVTNQNTHNVSVINTLNNHVTATIPAGTSPAGIVVSPDGANVYVADPTTQKIYIINAADNTVTGNIPIPTSPQGVSLNSDGSRLYVTDRANNLSVINTANNAIITKIGLGSYPVAIGNFITPALACAGQTVKLNITVNAATPLITATGTPSAVNTIYGTPSPSSSFVISGKDLTQGITVTPPPGFEISTDNMNFSNSLTVGGAGNVNDVTIYTRLAAITNAGTYSGDFTLKSPSAADVKVHIDNSTVNPYQINIFGRAEKVYGDAIPDQTLYYNSPGFVYPDPGLQNGNKFYSLHFGFTGGNAADSPVGTYSGAVVVSDFQGQNGFLASNYILNYTTGDVVVEPAPLIITAKPVNKPYGTTLSNIVSSTEFTVTGLKNNETIGSVSVSYGSGGAATDPAGVYNGSVSVSDPTGGTFNPTNYDITYATADITIDAATRVIITTIAPNPVNTIYGTPSESSNFTISGNTLSTGITVTPPTGFEVSTDNVNFGNTAIVGAGGTVNATVVYIRLAATTDTGPYSGNIILTSGATQATVFMPVSTVSPAPLTIAGISVSKTYGTALQNYTGPDKFTITAGSLKNGNTISAVSINYGAGADAGSPAGKYSGSVVPGTITGANGFKVSNYTITNANADIAVVPAILTITAANQTRDYGTDNPALTFTYSGFVNADTETRLTTLPVAATTATITSAPGKYPITINGAISPDYTFNYNNGVLTVTPLPDAVLVVPNTFTPNGDGINDTWNLPALASYPNCTVNIYDRYGQMVFHSIGYPTPWDGRQASKNVPTGVYYYIIDKKNNTGPVSGSLTVLR